LVASSAMRSINNEKGRMDSYFDLITHGTTIKLASWIMLMAE